MFNANLLANYVTMAQFLHALNVILLFNLEWKLKIPACVKKTTMTLLMGLPIVPYVKVAITHVTNAMITGLKTVCSVVKILLIIGTCTQIKITNVYAKQITMMMERVLFA